MTMFFKNLWVEYNYYKCFVWYDSIFSMKNLKAIQLQRIAKIKALLKRKRVQINKVWLKTIPV